MNLSQEYSSFDIRPRISLLRRHFVRSNKLSIASHQSASRGHGLHVQSWQDLQRFSNWNALGRQLIVLVNSQFGDERSLLKQVCSHLDVLPLILFVHFNPTIFHVSLRARLRCRRRKEVLLPIPINHRLAAPHCVNGCVAPRNYGLNSAPVGSCAKSRGRN
jgi:hypothetical protein